MSGGIGRANKIYIIFLCIDTMKNARFSEKIPCVLSYPMDRHQGLSAPLPRHSNRRYGIPRLGRRGRFYRCPGLGFRDTEMYTSRPFSHPHKPCRSFCLRPRKKCRLTAYRAPQLSLRHHSGRHRYRCRLRRRYDRKVRPHRRKQSSSYRRCCPYPGIPCSDTSLLPHT